MAANNEIGVLQPVARDRRDRKGSRRPPALRRGTGAGEGPVRRQRARRGSRLVHRAQDVRTERGGRALRPRRTASSSSRRSSKAAGRSAGCARARSTCLASWASVAPRRLPRPSSTASPSVCASCATGCWSSLRARVPGLHVNGSLERRLPHNLNVTSPAWPANRCWSASATSRVVRVGLLIGQRRAAVRAEGACARPRSARASIRFGLGRYTTEEEIDYAAGKVADVVHQLRQMTARQRGSRLTRSTR